MWIGVGRIVLDYYNNDSAKRKNRELEALCKDLRRKFNLSCLEVADFDDPERCVIGFAAVMPQHWKEPAAQSFIRRICEEIDTTAFARVTVEDTELFSHGD